MIAWAGFVHANGVGHQTVNMTMRYAHLAPSHLREAVQRIFPGAW
jgi:site-specific recombinase XerD